MSDFKSRLKELRIGRHLTQRELAQKLGLSNSAIAMYENGSRTPDQETLESISDYFNVSIDYLFGRENISMRFLSKAELELIDAYRSSSPDLQFAARAVLGLPKEVAESSSSEKADAEVVI